MGAGPSGAGAGHAGVHGAAASTAAVAYPSYYSAGGSLEDMDEYMVDGDNSGAESLNVDMRML